MEMKSSEISFLKCLQVALVMVLVSIPLYGMAAAQSLPFEDKAKYEKTLEQKVDEVLVKMLGPNQAKVIVETTMDFSRTEKLEVSSKVTPDAENTFKDYLVPGFPAFGSTGSESKSYNREMLYPSAFVKKMNVSVILNREIPDADAANIRSVVSEILMLDLKRGDQLSVIKAPFAPLWRTIWYTPEALSMVLKYVMLAIMGIIAMIVVAVGFLKLAGAMSTMAKVQQSHQITMDLGKGAGPAGLDSGGGLGGMLERPPLSAQQKEAHEDESKMVFNVRPEQVPFLVNLMSTEDPANVALVSAHLPAEVRAQFLKRLPSGFASEVVIHMAKIRFVEPEVIGTIKDELERRLSGAIGGLEGVMEALSAVDLRAQKEMIEEMRKKEPELAAEVRRHVLMPEDMALFSDKELSLMAGAIKIDEWATALFELPENVKQRIKAQMADRTWQMIEQSMKYGAPSPEKIAAAIDRVMGVAASFIKEGRIANPAEAQRPMIESEGAGA